MQRHEGLQRIAQICSSRSWGGLEMHVSTLCEWLLQAGLEVVLFCAPGSPLSMDARRKGIPQQAFAPAGYVDVNAAIKLHRRLRSLDTHLLHAHYSKDLWIIAPALYMGVRLPLVFSKHIGTQKAKKDPLHRWIYGSVNRLVAISKVIHDNVLATHPVAADRVCVLHHGLDLKWIRAGTVQRDRVRRDWGVRRDEILIGTIGRIQSGKGHLEFLEMAGRVAAQFPHVRFVIVGEPTRGEEARAAPVYRKAKELRLDDRLLFAGFRSDIPAVLAALDIFAFPSRAEAFGLVLIEAMAAGKAVVSTRCDGVLDIIDEGVDGLMFAPMDIDDLSKQVTRLVQDDELRQRLAMAALEKAQTQFSREQMINKLYGIYREAQTDAAS